LDIYFDYYLKTKGIESIIHQNQVLQSAIYDSEILDIDALFSQHAAFPKEPVGNILLFGV